MGASVVLYILVALATFAYGLCKWGLADPGSSAPSPKTCVTVGLVMLAPLVLLLPLLLLMGSAPIHP